MLNDSKLDEKNHVITCQYYAFKNFTLSVPSMLNIETIRSFTFSLLELCRSDYCQVFFILSVRLHWYQHAKAFGLVYFVTNFSMRILDLWLSTFCFKFCLVCAAQTSICYTFSIRKILQTLIKTIFLSDLTSCQSFRISTLCTQFKFEIYRNAG